MTNTSSAKPATTLKKLVTAAAIAGALGLAALGMAGTAAAEPTHDSGSTHTESSAPHAESSAAHAESSAPHANVAAPHAESSAPHAESSAPHAEAASPTGDSVVHAHLIPGVKLQPPAADDAQTVHPTLGSTSNPHGMTISRPGHDTIYPGPAPDSDPNCGPACDQLIH